MIGTLVSSPAAQPRNNDHGETKSQSRSLQRRGAQFLTRGVYRLHSQALARHLSNAIILYLPASMQHRSRTPVAVTNNQICS
jgi:hypothetical protein